MKYYFTTLLAFLLIFSSCSQVNKTADSQTTFQSILDKKSNTSTGVLMAVYAPKLDVKWQGSAGFDSKTKEHKLKPNQPFRIASITKTFTAVSILRLHEMGKLDINDLLKNYISKTHITLLENDGYDLNKITIKQCLQHTSSLFDYALAGNAYIEAAIENPKKRWTRTEQVEFAMKHGKPVGNPGEKYHYSDTGYVLLGEIIERLTGKGLAEANKQLINFKKIGLNSTWLQSLEPAPKGLPKMTSCYLETLDATDWDNSVDLYGGGGYVSTTKDLTNFYHHLFNDNIFEKETTLKLMLSKNGITNQGSTAESYRMGLWEVKTPNGNGYMHNGFWGSAVIYFPDYNLTIATYHVDDFNNDVMKNAFNEIIKLSKQ